MNNKVQEFINKMKAEQREKELKERGEHLISLGLIDEDKSNEETEYSDYYGGKDWKWDYEKNKYYKTVGIKVPVEVTDEEYQEILKYAPVIEKEVEEIVKPEPETPTANAIRIIATILLILMLIVGVVSLILSEWIPIVSAIIYSIFYYPFIIGFSKIVKVAEKQL
jgi:hypothetical protein